ncbi:hypothetical protein AB0C74_39700 [Spirillospora sp. NPDC048832]
MTAGAGASAGHCAVCGGPLAVRAGRPGRPAAWCSKGCRQTAYRARQAAARAAERAAYARRRLAAAHAELQRAEAAMAAAYGRAADRAAEPAADAAEHLTGGPRWETAVRDAAARLAAAARRLGDLAAEHDRARAEHAAALAVFRRPPAPRPSRDEIAPADVAAAVAVRDVDALFDAAEDVIAARDAGTLPPDQVAALRPDLDRLAAAFGASSGDDASGLAEAAAALAAYVTPAALASGEVPDVVARLAATVTTR